MRATTRNRRRKAQVSPQPIPPPLRTLTPHLDARCLPRHLITTQCLTATATSLGSTNTRHVTHQQAPPPRQTLRTRSRLDPKTTRRRGERWGNADDHDEQTKEDAGTSPQPTPPSSNADPPLQSSACERHVKRPDHGLTKTAADKPQPRVNNDSGSFDSDNGRSNDNNDSGSNDNNDGGSFDNNSGGLMTNVAS